MSNSISSIFGAIIAFLLFLIYLTTIIFMLSRIFSLNGGGGTSIEFNTGITYVVTTIGGLVSALVIAQLAVTKPGENPAIVKVANVRGEFTQHKTATSLAYFYLGGWLLAGTACLIIGVMIYPDASKTISDIGTTWLGLAVAAGYSYFGIQPGA